MAVISMHSPSNSMEHVPTKCSARQQAALVREMAQRDRDTFFQSLSKRRKSPHPRRTEMWSVTLTHTRHYRRFQVESFNDCISYMPKQHPTYLRLLIVQCC